MKRIATFFVCLCWFSLGAGPCGAATSVVSELSNKAESLLQSGQFAALDAMARTLQQQDARFPGGDPQIYAFYDGLGAISDGGCACAKGDLPFALKQKAVAQWLSANPDSAPAHIAMAMLWINYAWAARGGEAAAAVSQQDMHDYDDRLKTASRYVAKVDPAHNLTLYYERTLLAEITPSPRDAIIAAFAATVHADPAWFPIYAREAEMLKEKWYGEPGELVRFAKSLLTARDAEIGLTAYAEIATDLVGGIAYNDGFEAISDDWPALKRAYAAKENRYRLSEDDVYALLRYAALFHDQETVDLALQHMRDYAGQGYTLDMNNLGSVYLFGTGVAPQRDLTISWFRKGAALGNVASQYQLGWIFERSPGGGPEALKWYDLAAAQGNSTAINNMGFMFENGRGVTQDYGRAATLYEKAAAEGDERAEYHLGMLYERGLGVAKDEALAIQWLLKAAHGGDSDARKWLLGRQMKVPAPGKAA